MITLRFRPTQILIDIDTQRDLFVADGAASVCNHRQLLATIRRVMAAARCNHIPIISTAQMYHSSPRCPGYCIEGTEGLKKLRYTVRDNYLCYPASGSTDLPFDLLTRYNQIIFYKRCENPFEEPRLDRLLTQLRADELFLIGATAEGSVKATAMGLLTRGKNVTLLTDAIGTRNKAAADRALLEMSVRGAVLSKATEVIGASMLRKNHVCSCRYCKRAATGS